MRIGLTGSTGFLGRNLYDNLTANKKNEVFRIDRCFDNSYKLDNLPDLDFLIHLGAMTKLDQNQIESDFFVKNYLSTIDVLDYIVKKTETKLIFLSSYLYGNPDYLPIDENHKVNPTTPYTQSKHLSEKVVEYYAKNHNLNVLVLRPFNIFGLGQSNQFLIPKIIEGISLNEINLECSLPKRDFLYIRDFENLINKILNIGFEGYDIYNLGFGNSLSVLEVVQIIKKVTKSNCKVNFSELERKGDVLNLYSNPEKLKSKFDWEPKYNFEEGIIDMLNK